MSAVILPKAAGHQAVRPDSYTATGSSGFVLAELVWTRWGGGAKPGLYHLFLSVGSDPIRHLTRWPLGALSQLCVVNDFGDLVAVETPA